MRFSKWLLCLVLFALTASSALADDRINQVHHFGGDVLYCTHEDGCWLVNIHGEPLWEVAQATVDAAVAAACATGEAQVIAAGNGTYGPSQLVVGCPSSVTLVGYDEWGKQNTMEFTTDYLPVYPAPSGSGDRCAVDLAANKFASVDGIHVAVGFDIWFSGDDNAIFDDDSEFLYWSSTSEGNPICEFLAA
jgi:hypothetical protein